jgi:D-xylose 1-dehydrogenase (NADP+, D-xylono-1,5-lactone-forming)
VVFVPIEGVYSNSTGGGAASTAGWPDNGRNFRLQKGELAEWAGVRILFGMLGKLRWGILGTGNIARQFAAGLNSSRRGVAAAVGSRSTQSAEAFSKNFGMSRGHGSYEDLVADGGIDAVYNSLPNSLHGVWTIRALSAGKHVLCEKPLAMNAAEAQGMFEAAGKAGKVLMEAFMYRTHPQTSAVMEAVRSGTIGKVRLIRTSFCFRTRKIDGNVRFVRELGGGGLMDVGCYCINFARLFAEGEPSSVQASASFHESGVDELAAGTLVFPDGIVSTFACGLCVQADNSAYICGTEGYIEIPVPWKPVAGSSKFIVTGGVPPKMDNPQSVAKPPARDVRAVDFSGDLYGIEADAFAGVVLDGNAPAVSQDDSLGNMRVLDEMRRQIGLVF